MVVLIFLECVSNALIEYFSIVGPLTLIGGLHLKETLSPSIEYIVKFKTTPGTEKNHTYLSYFDKRINCEYYTLTFFYSQQF